MIELIIVIVILGVVATLAIPRMSGTTEQARLSEGISAIESFHAAQMRYALEHSGAYTNNCTLLDIDITPKNFGAPVCAASGSVSMTRNGGAYTVTETIAGVFSCSGSCTGLRLPN